MRLPGDLDPIDFDRRYRHDASSWLEAVTELCLQHGRTPGAVVPCAQGSNLIATVDDDWIVKIFPPFLVHQWECERRVLPRMFGALPVRTPKLHATGTRDDGWNFVILEKLHGTLLERCWAELRQPERASILEQIGATMAAAHRLPVGDLASLPPRWDHFARDQIAGCRARHERLGAPSWLLDGLEGFLDEHAAEAMRCEQPVILTGEYTPINLLAEKGSTGWHLSGMFDFGDAMIGPARYDWAGPAAFLCAGEPTAMRAFLAGVHGDLAWSEAGLRMSLLAILLLHRYADLDAQLCVPGWRERCSSLEELAFLVWPKR